LESYQRITVKPADYYGSPACIGAFLYTAWRKGEMREALRWQNDLKSRSRPARADSEVITLETDVEVTSSARPPDGFTADTRRRESGQPGV